jgi:hypothetical protein
MRNANLVGMNLKWRPHVAVGLTRKRTLTVKAVYKIYSHVHFE